ncbi:MAG TPA: pyridoxamine 5'-phosphate oxidase family protein [Acidimicrobiales bacterium]|nr:pyridoxamine 5'-phosphate oxidase family protein [Acidimicrobiales bacterium]
MGKTYDAIYEDLAIWLEAQPIFFVSTAPLRADGVVNCSPKGNRDEFIVVSGQTIAYVDQTGSGIETIAHLQENGWIVVMFCAFVGPPRIVRLHGTGRIVRPNDPEFSDLAQRLPRANGIGVRSIIVVDVKRISDSCGYGVPLMAFEGHRPTMDQWSNRKGPAGIREYWADKNVVSIDGMPGLGQE